VRPGLPAREAACYGLAKRGGTVSDQPVETARAVGNGHDPYAQRHFLRNAAMIALENAGFLIAITFVGSSTVLPTFVTRLGGSTFLVGFITTCQSAGWLLPQLAAAGLCAGKPRMLPYILVPLYIGRPAFLVVGILAAILGPGSSWIVLAVLYLALIAFYGTDGIASVPWYELVAKTIPPNRRGRMFGSAQIAGGLGGMAVGALVAVILKSPGLPFPLNYALLFGASSATFFLNLVPFYLVKEPVHVSGEEAPPQIAPRVFLRSLAGIVRRDRNFVRLVGSRLALGIALSVFPFYILFMDTAMSVDPARLGLFTSAQVFGGFVGGLVIGWIADHAGTRAAIGLSGAISGAVPALGLVMIAARGLTGDALLFTGVGLFVLMGVLGSASMIGFMNYLMEAAPSEQRTIYLGLFNTAVGAVLVVPPLMGWLLSIASFGLVFALALAASVLSLLLSLSLRKPSRAR
jgi:MFS family permease